MKKKQRSDYHINETRFILKQEFKKQEFNFKNMVFIYDQAIEDRQINAWTHCLNPKASMKLEGGEEIKTLAQAEKLLKKLQELHALKDTCLVVCGGGTVLDLCGFVASIYCRGMGLILIPSTMLAAVDACCGGKNGINFEGFKNWVGTFYPPHAVIFDLELLQKLDQTKINEGCVEAYKHALIASEPFFLFLEQKPSFQNPEVLEKFLRWNIEIKTQFVSKDLFDQGLRKLLNFGHTLGHHIEVLSEFAINHAEAVAYGMILESIISYFIGQLQLQELKKIEASVKHFCLKKDLFDKLNFCRQTIRDKKSKSDGTIESVVLQGIGKAQLNTFCSQEYHALVLQAVHLFKASFNTSDHSSCKTR